MSEFAEALNDILFNAYRNIINLEEKSLQKISKTSLSINEMHLIEIVKKYGELGAPINRLATKMHITRPSATVAVDKLVKKGYVQKHNCKEDGRQVRVTLTDEGIKIDNYHKQYHREMVDAVSKELNDVEKLHLISGIRKLNEYFLRSIEEEK